MKILQGFFSFMILYCSSLAANYHEFQGISEIYNIRNLTVLAKFLPEHPVIIEGGAYNGRDTIKLAKKFPTGTIIAFEPLTSVFPTLMQYLQPFPNVVGINMALDESSGRKKFYVCHGSDGKSPIYEFHSSLLKPNKTSGLKGPIEMVSCCTIEEFCKANHISKIDMLWISTEGNELQILKGCHHLLQDVTLIYARTHFSMNRESITCYQDLRKFLEQNEFILLSHFYLKNIHGDSIFIKKNKFNLLPL